MQSDKRKSTKDRTKAEAMKRKSIKDLLKPATFRDTEMDETVSLLREEMAKFKKKKKKNYYYSSQTH